MRIVDISGHRYGKLTVLHRHSEKSKSGRIMWFCVCDCGKTCVVQSNNLRSGNTKSCGCEGSRTKIGQKFATHGIPDDHPVYRAWNEMKKRCYSENHKNYNRWGRRGIRVCDEWLYDFKAFYDWSLENGWEKGLSIDRIDNDGNYEPSNCRWATAREQAINRSSTIWIECGGERLCLIDWSRKTGLCKDTIKQRLKRGWTVEKALFTEPMIGRNQTWREENE